MIKMDSYRAGLVWQETLEQLPVPKGAKKKDGEGHDWKWSMVQAVKPSHVMRCC